MRSGWRARIGVCAALVAVLLAGTSCGGSDSATPSPGGQAGPAGAASPTTGRAGSVATAGTTGTTTTRAPACTPARPAPKTDGPIKASSKEGDRDYLLSLPDNYDGSTPVGLILNMHGSGSNKEQQVALTSLPKKAAARGYAVVSPDGTGQPRGFNMFGRPGSPDDYAFLGGLVEKLSNELCIDKSRVYATGISNGSAMSMFVACREPYRFAAVALVAATVPGNCPENVRPSILAFHGKADKVVPYGGGTVNASAANGVAAPGAESTMANWAKRYGCTDKPAEEKIGAGATHFTWSCPNDVGLQFYGLDGAGHTWPGGIDLEAVGIKALGATNKDVSATDLMLDFFDAHRATWS